MIMQAAYMPTVIAIRGPYDTAKSTLGLTLPGKKLIIDLEYGAGRAVWRFPEESYIIWQMPEHLRPAPSVDGLVDRALAEIVHIPGERLRGYREALGEIVAVYFKALRATDIDVIIFDTAKELWITVHKAHLQRLHDEQLAAAKSKSPGVSVDELERLTDFRKRLQPIEYGDPNSQMKKIIDLAHQWHKTLVLVNHERDVYASVIINGQMVEKPTGEKELDGYSHTMDLADWVIATSRVDIKPEGPDVPLEAPKERHYKAVIIKSPFGKAVVGQDFIDPTFPTIARVASLIGRAQLANNHAS